MIKDIIIHNVGAKAERNLSGEVVQCLGRGFAERLDRAGQIGQGFADGNQAGPLIALLGFWAKLAAWWNPRFMKGLHPVVLASCKC